MMWLYNILSYLCPRLLPGLHGLPAVRGPHENEARASQRARQALQPAAEHHAVRARAPARIAHD